MNKKWIFIIVLLISFSKLNAQTRDSDIEQVRDDVTRETFITFHKRQLENFEIMREKEGTIAATQELVKKESEEIARIRNNMYVSLTQVSSYIMDIRSLIAIAQDIEQTYRYIHDCDSITLENPELLFIAMQTKVALYNRIEELGIYLTLATTGGELNLMNNADRLKFISRVSMDMRLIKSTSCYLRYELELAVKNGFWRSLFPGLFVWQDNIQYKISTCERIISSFHL